MSVYVARTCTEVGAADASWPLKRFRDRSAYVLLGDPGSGKTTEFMQEQAALGDTAVCISARDFITFRVDSHPEWGNKTLFIDGLDEMRAGATDLRSSLDEVRSRLDQLGRPSFRLSCREADWLGDNDLQSLEAVSPDSQIAILRLDPLSDDDIAELLSDHPVPSGAQEFIDEAEQRGLRGLLSNPQTLTLLADTVAHCGEWPESRLETFEMACRQMAEEQNQEHRIGAGVSPEDAVLDAAGYLCALNLIADVPGFSTYPSADHQSMVPIHSLEEMPALPPREVEAWALKTRLFVAASDNGHAPVHRHLAEFLAGRYLAKLIGNGLPASRVVALLTRPTDGRVVTTLRGLSAWLAAHSPNARGLLIDADPVGVGLYGDIGSFSADEKKHLLESLGRFAALGPLLGHEQRDGRAEGYCDTTAWAFRSLLSADTAAAIRDLLADPDPTDDKHRIAEFILTVLAAAESTSLSLFGDLESVTEAIVRNNKQPPDTRRLALDVYLRMAADQDPQVVSALRLLDDIRARAVSDPDDDLSGTLLRHLYPAYLPPSQIWGYVLPRNRRNRIGRFAMFWHSLLLRQSDDHHVAELLDSLCEEAPQINADLEQAGFGDLPLELLGRGLEAWGDELEPPRLFDWLSSPSRSPTVRPPRAWSSPVGEVAGRIKDWLEARPVVQKSVFLTWVRRNEPNQRHELFQHWRCNALHRSKPPADFGLWCLDMAHELSDSEPFVSKELFTQAYRSLDAPAISEGLTLGDLEQRAQGDHRLAVAFEELRTPPTPKKEHQEWEQEHQERMAEYERSKRQQQSEWANEVRSRQEDLMGNRAPPRALDLLARVYFSLVIDVDMDARPRDRICKFLGGDTEMADVVLTALREAAFRDDLPEADRTISLYSESRHHFLAYPVLASLDLLEAGLPSRLGEFNDEQRRKILAIRYCVPDTLRHESTAPCHDRWLDDDPDLVFDMLYRCAVAALKGGDEYPPGLYDLDRVEGQANRVIDVSDELLFRVNDTRVRLLRAFPVRAPSTQLSLLDRLLGPALRFSDRAALEAVVEKKIGAKSATDAQKVRWLTAGALISPSQHREALRDFIASNDERARHLAEFLRSSSAIGRCTAPTLLGDVIQILGRLYRPLFTDGWVTLEMAASEHVASMIARLGSLPSLDAHHVLAELMASPQLDAWQDHLQRSLESQRVLRGDASYLVPSIEQVQATLSNTLPANEADLAALVEDRLREMSPRLRGDSSNLWRQFWNEDPYGRPTDPKPEESCRDAVLALLQNGLPDGVEAVPEGHYAASTRADIRVSYDGHNIPIELKKDTHPDLWAALRSQLICQYTTDPATGGHGVYVPLWFGRGDRKPTSPPHGPRPTTAEELQQRIEQDLTPEEVRKISVIALDVSKPGA